MRCKNCKQKFVPRIFLQKYCEELECIKAFNDARKQKIVDDRVKKMKEDSKTKGDYLTILQAVFNTYIRERDKDLPCVSCGCKTANKWDAGHFYPTTYSFLRFDEDNCHKQCSNNCNLNKHGNLSEYRPRLIERIGLQRVLRLDNSRHFKLELTIPEIKDLITEYKQKIKDLKTKL